jgi:catechol 2,3-dioxygenase-like lactoylglutathione lyase family enzyme
MFAVKLVTMLLTVICLFSLSEELPRITGIAQIGYYTGDLNKARAYYVDFLGFDEAFCLKNPDGTEHSAFFKINDHQYIKLVAESPKNYGFLNEVAFQTNDAIGLRTSLAGAGIKVPRTVVKDQTGNLSFEINDPYGFTIRIIQYQPGSLTSLGKGKSMPPSRFSTQIDHVGLLFGDREKAAEFYRNAFGFTREGNKMRIGDGSDRFELGFERKPPTAERFHIKNHICLSVADVPKTVSILRAKPAARNFREIETHALENGKNVAEMYDPDGNRIELMEPPKK